MRSLVCPQEVPKSAPSGPRKVPRGSHEAPESPPEAPVKRSQRCPQEVPKAPERTNVGTADQPDGPALLEADPNTYKNGGYENHEFLKFCPHLGEKAAEIPGKSGIPGSYTYTYLDPP